MRLKLTLLLFVLLPNISYSQDSGISISGGIIHGNVSSHTGDNIRYGDTQNFTLMTANYSVNITKEIKSDSKLFNDLKKQFHLGFTKLTDLNKKQRKILNEIIKKINLSLSNQGKIIIKQNELVYNQKKLLEGQEQILEVVQSLNQKFNTPEMIKEFDWQNSHFCKDLDLREINQIVIYPEALFNYKYNQDGITHRREEEKLKCLKTLFNPYQTQKYKIKLHGNNQKIVDKVIDKIVKLSSIQDSKLSSNYQPSTNVVRFELLRLSY